VADGFDPVSVFAGFSTGHGLADVGAVVCDAGVVGARCDRAAGHGLNIDRSGGDRTRYQMPPLQ